VVKFFIAGCFAGTTDLVFLFIFHSLLHWPIVVSTSLAFIFSFVVSFTMQKLWTFRNFNHDKTAGQFILYIINAFITLNLNGIMMRSLVINHHIWYILSQIIVNVSIGTYNFFIYRWIVFKIDKDEISNKQKTIGSEPGDVASDSGL